MEESIKQSIHDLGAENIEILLFGQNFTFTDREPRRSQGIINASIEHTEMTLRIKGWNVPGINIRDYRRPGTKGSDSTIYDSGSNTIYHVHESLSPHRE